MTPLVDGSTSLGAGLAAFVCAAMLLVVSLRLRYVDNIGHDLLVFLAGGKLIVGVALLALHGARAIEHPRTSGEVLGMLAGITFIVAAAFTARARKDKVTST